MKQRERAPERAGVRVYVHEGGCARPTPGVWVSKHRRGKSEASLASQKSPPSLPHKQEGCALGSDALASHTHARTHMHTHGLAPHCPTRWQARPTLVKELVEGTAGSPVEAKGPGQSRLVPRSSEWAMS